MGKEFESDNPLIYENGNNGDDWKKYKIWVIDNIRRLRTEVDGLRSQINDVVMAQLNELENKITALQVKSGIWGLIAGLLGVVIAMVIKSQFGV